MCEVNWQMLLEYLKVGLSWPPLVFAGAMICIWKFQAELARILARLERVKAGGFEANVGAAQQAQFAKLDAAFPLPGEGPGEALGNQQQAQPPQGQPALAENQTAGVDLTVSEEAAALVPGADLPQAVQWTRQNPGPMVKDYILANASLKCERSFNLIFGTQVEVLEYLRVLPGTHTMAELLPFHERHVALVNAPQAVAVPVYLSFLLTQGLMENVGPPEGPLYRLTHFGQWFLGKPSINRALPLCAMN